MSWRKARKKPVVIEFREVEPAKNIFDPINHAWYKAEVIRTLEGDIVGIVGRDYVIRGVKGEVYPIRKDIFEETYEVVEG